MSGGRKVSLVNLCCWLEECLLDVTVRSIMDGIFDAGICRFVWSEISARKALQIGVIAEHQQFHRNLRRTKKNSLVCRSCDSNSRS